MVRLREESARFPIAAIFPSRMPMSPEYQGEPVPSIMWPFVMTRSNDCTQLPAEQNRIRARRLTNANPIHCVMQDSPEFMDQFSKYAEAWLANAKAHPPQARCPGQATRTG